MLVLDIGGTAIKIALADEKGHLLPSTVTQRPACADGSYDDFITILREIIRDAQALTDIPCASVSIPGPFDYANGISQMEHKFQALYQRSLKVPFDEAGIPVHFLHDSTAFLLGEIEDTDPDNCCGIMLGTGLGFALMRNRHVLVDATQTPALSLWCWPFHGGIAEDYISTRALLSAMPELSNVLALSEAARSGNQKAADAFHSEGHALSELLGALLPQLGVDAVLFGGQISLSLDLFELTLPLPWRVCKHPEEAALRGAARYAVESPEKCITVVPAIAPGGEIHL